MNSGGLVSRALDVFDIRPAVEVGVAVDSGFASQFQNAIAQAPQEGSIVGDEDHGSFEI